MVGRLLYASNKTRPDITYNVNFCSRYSDNSTLENITDLKHIQKYLNGCKELGIEYKNDHKLNLIEAYSDADYAGDLKDCVSTTGYVIKYAGGAISWGSKKQKSVIALSNTESEYVAAAQCSMELLYIKTLFEELLNREVSIHLNIDNQSTLALIKME